MSDAVLTDLRDIIQDDIGQRGLRRDPERNLINACPDDFRLACHSLADHPRPALGVVTGFFIPTATPPAGETDGPLGALFLARALVPLGIPVVLITDDFCVRALDAGLRECGLRDEVPLIALPAPAEARAMSDDAYRRHVLERTHGIALTHLLAIERVGPNAEGRCHTMRGRDITELMSPAHRLFPSEPEASAKGISSLTLQAPRITLGIGDGGNEIGMGKIPRDVIASNITNGDLVACQIATQHLIVCGISNWGAYALAAGVRGLRSAFELAAPARDDIAGSGLFDPRREHEILEIMVKAGPLVDGVTGQPTATVDGIPWDAYAEVLERIGQVVTFH